MKIKLAIVGVFLIFSVSVVYLSDAIFFRLADKADEVFWPHQRVLSKVRNGLGKTLDSLNPLFNKKNILSALDVYEFSLSPQDIRYFYKNLLNPSRDSEWLKPDKQRKAGLLYKGSEYKIKMKLHGDTVSHWSGAKKSFQIKLSNEQFLQGRNRFIFHIPEKRHYLLTLFASRLAQRMGLPSVQTDLVTVKTNGVFQGIYVLEEYLDNHFLERNRISNGALVQLSDNWIEDRLEAGNDPKRFFGGITFNDHHITPFDLEMANLKQVRSPLKIQGSERIVHEKARQLMEAIRDGDLQRFEDLVDTQRLGAVDAWRTVLGDTWALFGDNARWVYTFSNGKFFLVPRNQGMLTPLEYEGGSFEYRLDRIERDTIPLFRLMTRSGKIRQARDRWLWNLLNDKQSIIAEYDRLVQKYLPLLIQDSTQRLSSRELRHEILGSRGNLVENLSKLQAQFDYAKVYVGVILRGSEWLLEITPDTSLQSLEIKRLRLNFGKQTSPPESCSLRLENISEISKDAEARILFDGEISPQTDLAVFFAPVRLGYDYDSECRPLPKKYRFRFDFAKSAGIKPESIDLAFVTSLAQKDIPADDVYLIFAEAGQELQPLKHRSLEAMAAAYPGIPWQIEGQRLKIPSGNYLISENLVIPEGCEVRIEKNTQLLLAPGVSVLSFSPIHAEGSPDGKIVVQASNPQKPFGAFAVVNTEDKKSSLSYFELSGGSETLIDGLYLSGGLCFYHADVNLKYSKIHSNRADDGLNVKYAAILIEDSEFSNNDADQIDLDFCQGRVRNCRFLSSKQNDNGDGLDVSGSEVLIQNCSFENFLDKGLSVGEDSRVLVEQSRFSRNRLGAAVKDSSSALFMNDAFLGNQTAISGYQKKPIFNHGVRVFLHANRFEDNRVLFELDPHSLRYAASPSGAAYLESATEHSDFKILDTPGYWRPQASHERR